MEAFDPGVPFADPAVAGLERTMIADAFASLPERLADGAVAYRDRGGQASGGGLAARAHRERRGRPGLPGPGRLAPRMYPTVLNGPRQARSATPASPAGKGSWILTVLRRRLVSTIIRIPVLAALDDREEDADGGRGG
jgi:hypothetical protein